VAETVVPVTAASSRGQASKLDLARWPKFNDWDIWYRTEWYRRNFSYRDFQREVARLNDFPNEEWYFRRIGPGSFPSGRINLPPLPSGRFYDLPLRPAVSQNSASNQSRPSVAIVTVPAPGTFNNDLRTVRTDDRLALLSSELRQLSEKITVFTTKVIDLQSTSSSSSTQKIVYLPDQTGPQRLAASLEAMSNRLAAKLDLLGSQLAKLPVTAVSVPAKPVFLARHPIWLWLLVATLLCGIPIIIRLWQVDQKRVSRVRILERKLADSHTEYERLSAAIPEGFEQFTVPADLANDIYGLREDRLIFLPQSPTDPSLLVPPCRNNPVMKKNMRNHLRNCSECRRILASRSEQRIHSKEEETASV
jgi:hypothetical protein